MEGDILIFLIFICQVVIKATIRLVKKDVSDKETPEHVPQPQSGG